MKNFIEERAAENKNTLDMDAEIGKRACKRNGYMDLIVSNMDGFIAYQLPYPENFFVLGLV
jgi:hypothetical protein